jgi:hypothetical protein
MSRSGSELPPRRASKSVGRLADRIGDLRVGTYLFSTGVGTSLVVSVEPVDSREKIVDSREKRAAPAAENYMDVVLGRSNVPLCHRFAALWTPKSSVSAAQTLWMKRFHLWAADLVW